MVFRSSNAWETSDRAELISTGSGHALWLSTSGPPRKHLHDPVILFFTGGGAPIAVYIRLQRLLSWHWRVYFHDRAGYDRSERGTEPVLTGQQSAKDLVQILERVQVGPPYVLMGHSYGGIVARAFLELLRDGVKGMVLADTATELMYELFQPEIPPPSLQAVAEGVDWGHLTHLKRDMQLTENEYQAALVAVARSAPAARDEDCRGTATALARAQQFQRHILSPWPVAVIRCNMARDFRVLYDAGVQSGQGTPDQREDARRFIEKMELFDDQVRAAQLRLSSCNKYIFFEDAGHDDILRRPEAYVEEVRWVMERAVSLQDGALGTSIFP